VRPALFPDTRNGSADRSSTGWTSLVEVPRIDYEKLADDRLGEKSEKVQARVTASRKRQQERFKGTKLNSNADMSAADVREYCKWKNRRRACWKRRWNNWICRRGLFTASWNWPGLSPTMKGPISLEPSILAEAIQYRPRSLLMWKTNTTSFARSQSDEAISQGVGLPRFARNGNPSRGAKATWRTHGRKGDSIWL